MRRTPSESSQRGNALIAAIVLVIAMIGLAMAMMTTSLADRKLARTARDYTQAFYVAEAGIQHAIAELAGGRSGAVGSSGAPLPFGGGTYWVAAVDNGDDSHTIVASSMLGDQKQAIEVVVDRELFSIFTKGLFGDVDLVAHGNVFVDSYDSDLGDYATQAVTVDGTTGRTYALANGSLGTNGAATVSGSVVVMGAVTPGPGQTVTINGASVHIDGPTAPAKATTSLPPVTYSPPVASSGQITGNTTLGAGTHRFSHIKLAAHKKLTITGDADLYIDGDVELTGQAEIVVQPGARLRIYHGGALLKLAGGGVVNGNQVPRAFVVQSTATTVKVSGNSTFYGAVYAPDALVDPKGTSEIFGSMVGRQVDIGGTSDFHFDEALSRDPEFGSSGSYRTVSWRKVPYGSPPTPAGP